MLQQKLFEVRDRFTTIEVLATLIMPKTSTDISVMKRAGFDVTIGDVILTNLETMETNYDAYKWGDRTLNVAHKYIIKNFDLIPNCWVVDVEAILGETKTMKVPERYYKLDSIKFLQQSSAPAKLETKDILDKKYGLQPDNLEFSVQEIKGLGLDFYKMVDELGLVEQYKAVD